MEHTQHRDLHGDALFLGHSPSLYSIDSVGPSSTIATSVSGDSQSPLLHQHHHNHSFNHIHHHNHSHIHVPNHSHTNGSTQNGDHHTYTHAPHQNGHIQNGNNPTTNSNTNPNPNPNGEEGEQEEGEEHYIIAKALYPFESTDPTSLSFNTNALIQVLTQLESGWWYGFCNDQRGWFPSNYVQAISEEELEHELELVAQKNSPDDEADDDGGDAEKDEDEDDDDDDDDDHDDDDDDVDIDDDDTRSESALVLQEENDDDGEYADDLWLPQITSEGHVYYFNTRTNESSWIISATGGVPARLQRSAEFSQEPDPDQDCFGVPKSKKGPNVSKKHGCTMSVNALIHWVDGLCDI
ncbi:hypothetical protein BG004_007121 [Podila humilis]|nr:hypothetical protein BG004_007121 [Podila humilis]